MYEKFDGAKTPDWDKAGKSWEKAAKPLIKAIGGNLSVDKDSVGNPDTIVFQRWLDRNNGKSAVVESFGVPKEFLRSVIYAFDEMRDELKEAQESIEFIEDGNDEEAEED